MRKIFLIAALALSLGGCAQLDAVRGAYRVVTETTVPAATVIPTANAFNILKNAATNYGRFCILKQMAPEICSADKRRIVVKAVRMGTKARNQLTASVEQGQPALSSIYNLLVAAVTDLQHSPVTSVEFVGGAQ